MSLLLAHSEALFVVDDIIVDESLDKQSQSLLKLAISGRHRNHFFFWLLTQSYSAMPKNLRRQAKAMFVWYPKEEQILNDDQSDDEGVIVREFLRTSKHACLHI